VNENRHHNQCLALQAVAILLNGCERRRDERGAYAYHRAARHLMPEFYEGETWMPEQALPKVIVNLATDSEQSTHFGDTVVRRRGDQTLPGLGAF
jgi:hypothetical protein